MISKAQIRAARGLLELSQGFIADSVGVSGKTISNIEAGQGDIQSPHLLAVVDFFESRGVEFIDNGGVRFKPSGLRHYRGPAEFREFYNDLYETARTVGGDITLLNGKSDAISGALGGEFVSHHRERMTKIAANFRYRVIVGEGDRVFFGRDFCEYRAISSKFFTDTTVFVFGNRVSFVEISGTDVEVISTESPSIAKTWRHAFEFFWLNAEEVPI